LFLKLCVLLAQRKQSVFVARHVFSRKQRGEFADFGFGGVDFGFNFIGGRAFGFLFLGGLRGLFGGGFGFALRFGSSADGFSFKLFSAVMSVVKFAVATVEMLYAVGTENKICVAIRSRK
jgi:hypothetical protein